MGIKQAGVPIGIFLAGVGLPAAAAVLDWQGAFAIAAIMPLVAGMVAYLLIPRDGNETRSRVSLRPTVPTGLIRWLLIFAFFMGGGVAATHTFLPLYSHEVLGFSEALAGVTLSLIGVTGIFSRILWTHLSDRAGRVQLALVLVAVSSVISALAIMSASSLGSTALWLGAGLQGASAVAWAPIAMLVVLQNVTYDEMGHASALVNLGFFAGFILSPPLFGTLVEQTGTYTSGWLMVVAQFLVAVGVLILWRRSRSREEKVATA